MLRVELWQECAVMCLGRLCLAVCLGGGGLRLLNSGALVLEEHWASGLMQYPRDPASEGLEFITHVPSLHSLTLWSSAAPWSPVERNTTQKPSPVSWGSLLLSVRANRESWKKINNVGKPQSLTEGSSERSYTEASRLFSVEKETSAPQFTNRMWS